jgi:alkylation response protein AidB-like acyl-CoA dehydrogenase
MATDLSDLTADELRARTREWLADHLPAGWMTAVDAGDNAEAAALRADLDYAKWCTEFGESGFATPTWPAEYGAGLSLSPGQARPVNEVLNQYRVPRPANIIGIGMGGPTVIAWGSEDVKQRFLRGIATNEEIWCQLFSEPGAGSDVAGLATRAERDGDEWVVNGQKVWTSLAHLARYGMLLARTDPDQPKHRGLSYFVVDMHQPGVDVRPLRQITGDAEFNEVFFDDVHLEPDATVGPVDGGWGTALTTLMFERLTIGAGSEGMGYRADRIAAAIANDASAVADPEIRARLGEIATELLAVRFTGYRMLTAIQRGQIPGPEAGLSKVTLVAAGIEAGDLIADAIGPEALGDSDWSYMISFLPGLKSAGGTEEILRNTVGERVLGLPPEPRLDKGIPFSELRAKEKEGAVA